MVAETTGSDLPVFDEAVLERTSSFLTPEAVATYLSTIEQRAEVVLHKLSVPAVLALNANDLSMDVHTLAGSAGMFGFSRMAEVARILERAIQLNASDALAVAAHLATTIQATQPHMHRHSSARARSQ